MQLIVISGSKTSRNVKMQSEGGHTPESQPYTQETGKFDLQYGRHVI